MGLLLFFIVFIIVFLICLILKGTFRKRKILRKLSEFVEANNFFKNCLNDNSYFNNHKYKTWRLKYQHLTKLVKYPYKNYKKYPEIISNLDRFSSYWFNGNKIISQRNIKYVEFELRVNKEFFDNFEKHPLNNKQSDAIICDEDNNLIIAGAGTGKTTTIVGKAAYLINRLKIDPKKILLLAFTRNAAEEIRNRILSKVNKSVVVDTFHSFGLSVIGYSEGEKPDLAFNGNENELRHFISNTFKELINDKNYLKNIIHFFINYLRPYKAQHQYENYGEYRSSRNLLTLNGERVKSAEELEIANFLFTNNVRYVYEADYEHKVGDREHRQYKADFYLPNYNIYIEHFAIDRNGNVPKWFSGKNGKSAKKIYNKGIKWKRKIHKKYGTILIETYSYEKQENTLFINLEKKLNVHSVDLKRKSDEEIFERIELNHSEEFPLLINLFISFINLIKSNQLTLEYVENKAISNDKHGRAKAFLNIFKPIFVRYESYLKENDKIDFNDMISKATNYIGQNNYEPTFDYVLIDEFQDISIGRYKLVKALSNKNKKLKIFAVGDDWQSIFRFTGSDISIMVDFVKYFGYSKIISLDLSYRFHDKIASFTGEFIQKNEKQLKKNLRTTRSTDDVPYEIIYKSHENDNSSLKQILKKIYDIAIRNNKSYSVFIIGRYNFTMPKNFDYLVKEYSKLKIWYLTAHRSKGLEADFIIIDNLITGKYGFPTEIVDDPLLNILLSKQEDFENAEERRLFYVALTRAREKIFLLTVYNQESKFILELKKSNGELPKCPSCDNGSLIQKKGSFGLFWGCNNYPYCDFTKKIKDFENIQF